MNKKALKTLEYHKIIAHLTEYASSEGGKRLCQTLLPSCDLKEIELALDNEFLCHPTKEYLASDLRKFLEGYPQVKIDIEHYIRHRLKQLWEYLYNREVIQRYRKMVIELEQQLKEKENDTELH